MSYSTHLQKPLLIAVYAREHMYIGKRYSHISKRFVFCKYAHCDRKYTEEELSACRLLIRLGVYQRSWRNCRSGTAN